MHQTSDNKEKFSAAGQRYYFNPAVQPVRTTGSSDIEPRQESDTTGETHYWANRPLERSPSGSQQFFSLAFASPMQQQEPAPNWNELSLTRSFLEKAVPATFPLQLMEVLSNESLSDIITWLPHGQGWIILDKKRFATEVLPIYFEKKSKWTSFTRKLNRWNFTRVTRGEEVGAYYHPLFQRGKKHWCLQMTCVGSNVPQSVEPLNPVALGLTTPNMIEQGLLLATGTDSSRNPTQDMQMDTSVQQGRHGEAQSQAYNVHSAQPPFNSQLSNPMAATFSGMPAVSSASSVNSSRRPQLEVAQQEHEQPRTRESYPLFDKERTAASFPPDPLAHYIDAYLRQAQAYKNTAKAETDARDRILAKLHAQGIPNERSSTMNSPYHRFPDDTLTLTPTSAMGFTHTGVATRPRAIYASRNPFLVDSQDGDEVGQPDEQQKISPSMFDSSSSDSSSDNDHGTRQHTSAQQFPPQMRSERQQEHDSNADDDSKLAMGRATSSFHLPPTTEGYHVGDCMKQQDGMHSVAELRASYMAAVLMLDQKNHGPPNATGLPHHVSRTTQHEEDEEE